MRICRHCSHQNADHLGYCSRCGKRLGSTTAPPAGGPAGPSGPARLGFPLSGQVGMLAAAAAVSPTVMATPSGARRVGGAGTGGAGSASASGHLAGAGNSIGYIYVYIRGKLHAGERRRRLIEERDGAQALLAGSVRDLGASILRDGVQHPDLTGLLEAIGRADARRAAAASDIDVSEKQKETEETHLHGQEAAAEVGWRASDLAARDAEEAVRAIAARLRHEPDPRPGAADERAVEEQRARVASVERDLHAAREKSAALRAQASAARAKLDEAAATHRRAASAMAASVAGHVRERAEAERAAADLTEQLGRAAAQLQPDRPAAAALAPLYQRIDRLQETIATRTVEIAAIERSSGHYDQRKLLTGVGLLTSMILATAAALWAVLK